MKLKEPEQGIITGIPLKISEIENSIYGKGGLYERTVKKIEEISIPEAVKITGKKRQSFNIYIHQFNHPEKYDYRPKFDTIKEIAEMIWVE